MVNYINHKVKIMKYEVNEHKAREKILEVAKSEFAKKGFQGTRMEMIAEVAGVNKALIHYYFKSKENLYESVLAKSLGHFEDDYDIPVFIGEKNLTRPQKIYLVTYMVVMSHFRASDNELNDIILWEVAEGGDILRKIHDDIVMPRYEPIMKIINDGIHSGEFSSKNTDLVMSGLHTMIHGFKIEEQRKIKATLFKIDNSDITETDYLDFCLEYIFKMLSPIDKPLKIPEMPKDIIDYIDKLIEIMKNKGISSNLTTQVLNILAE
jgi:hypothetical protein